MKSKLATFGGLEVLGQYGRGLVIEHELCPAGFFAVFATGGPSAASNVIGYREHEQPEWRGLRLIPGLRPSHPVVDSAFMRSFGVGVGTRHRGAACMVQLTTGSVYTAPAISF